ncbi:hypothetical protein [Allorhizobium taibaishanense]|uniref:Uncharacterized protein n=1 Tax=Allorhizobium taibaishanense TaxID=887144 RepID=A0A7W6HMV1_9HYPH|nr:hypothetical protein [Allorhizobium taibaishanense]MBB4007786.1 hypothetical protein [Allorhizobium taibaishanense]
MRPARLAAFRAAAMACSLARFLVGDAPPVFAAFRILFLPSLWPGMFAIQYSATFLLLSDHFHMRSNMRHGYQGALLGSHLKTRDSLGGASTGEGGMIQLAASRATAGYVSSAWLPFAHAFSFPPAIRRGLSITVLPNRVVCWMFGIKWGES